MSDPPKKQNTNVAAAATGSALARSASVAGAMFGYFPFPFRGSRVGSHNDSSSSSSSSSLSGHAESSDVLRGPDPGMAEPSSRVALSDAEASGSGAAVEASIAGSVDVGGKQTVADDDPDLLWYRYQLDDWSMCAFPDEVRDALADQLRLLTIDDHDDDEDREAAAVSVDEVQPRRGSVIPTATPEDVVAARGSLGALTVVLVFLLLVWSIVVLYWPDMSLGWTALW